MLCVRRCWDAEIAGDTHALDQSNDKPRWHDSCW
jgi:hypothetical protein